MSAPTFWMRMNYACDNPACDYGTTFLLEEGCERATNHRPKVPVPMVAGPCPSCNAGGNTPTMKDGRFGQVRSGYLVHANWQADQLLDPPVTGSPEQAHFRYPSRAERRRHGERACGRPVYAGGPS